MAVDTTRTTVRDYLRSLKYEALKMYRIYDGTNRLQYQYEAPTHALTGDPCMRTEYIYDATSTRVVKLVETIQTWDSSWDV